MEIVPAGNFSARRCFFDNFTGGAHEIQAGFHTQDEQVDHVRHRDLNLLLPLLAHARQVQLGYEKNEG